MTVPSGPGVAIGSRSGRRTSTSHTASVSERGTCRPRRRAARPAAAGHGRRGDRDLARGEAVSRSRGDPPQQLGTTAGGADPAARASTSTRSNPPARAPAPSCTSTPACAPPVGLPPIIRASARGEVRPARRRTRRARRRAAPSRHRARQTSAMRSPCLRRARGRRRPTPDPAPRTILVVAGQQRGCAAVEQQAVGSTARVAAPRPTRGAPGAVHIHACGVRPMHNGPRAPRRRAPPRGPRATPPRTAHADRPVRSETASSSIRSVATAIVGEPVQHRVDDPRSRAHAPSRRTEVRHQRLPPGPVAIAQLRRPRPQPFPPDCSISTRVVAASTGRRRRSVPYVSSVANARSRASRRERASSPGRTRFEYARRSITRRIASRANDRAVAGPLIPPATRAARRP